MGNMWQRKKIQFALLLWRWHIYLNNMESLLTFLPQPAFLWYCHPFNSKGWRNRIQWLENALPTYRLQCDPSERAQYWEPARSSPRPHPYCSSPVLQGSLVHIPTPNSHPHTAPQGGGWEGALIRSLEPGAVSGILDRDRSSSAPLQLE